MRVCGSLANEALTVVLATPSNLGFDLRQRLDFVAMAEGSTGQHSAVA
jgi:hypothetical protein